MQCMIKIEIEVEFVTENCSGSIVSFSFAITEIIIYDTDIYASHLMIVSWHWYWDNMVTGGLS